MLPALQRIYRKLGSLDGHIFFYGQQKPLGPVSQTKETSQDRENHCLIQSINRLGTFASNKNEHLMVVMDATDTDNRERAVATLGATIYSRNNKENRSIVEVPLQTESHLYSTVQMADWTCALLGRLTDYHFAEHSEFSWAVDLGREVFKLSTPTPNSIMWSNAETKDSKCFPDQLVNATPFWEIEQRRHSQQERKRLKNGGMYQRLIDASSPEFQAKLDDIRKGDTL
ncbi:DUF3800 domain-containing protein [Corynebacterium liangguodongii]|uniref:DUF3800 domain-containing protein n=1 Tax=Corynebacterium liangguodongii TaxID=2079535 RepID=UPI002E275A6D